MDESLYRYNHLNGNKDQSTVSRAVTVKKTPHLMKRKAFTRLNLCLLFLVISTTGQQDNSPVGYISIKELRWEMIWMVYFSRSEYFDSII